MTVDQEASPAYAYFESACGASCLTLLNALLGFAPSKNLLPILHCVGNSNSIDTHPVFESVSPMPLTFILYFTLYAYFVKQAACISQCISDSLHFAQYSDTHASPICIQTCIPKSHAFARCMPKCIRIFHILHFYAHAKVFQHG